MSELCKFFPTCDRDAARAKIVEALKLEPHEGESTQKIICTIENEMAKRKDCPTFPEKEAQGPIPILK